MSKVDKEIIKPIIRNSYDVVNSYSNSGSIYENEYGYACDEDGMKQLVIQGKKNVYEIIQSHKDDTNIYNILNRVLQGDYSMLDTNKGVDIDTDKLPKSLNEYHQFVIECSDKFNSLDPKIKSLFRNSIEYFAHCIENNTIDKVLSESQSASSSNDSDNVNDDKVINNESEVKDNGHT